MINEHEEWKKPFLPLVASFDNTGMCVDAADIQRGRRQRGDYIITASGGDDMSATHMSEYTGETNPNQYDEPIRSLEILNQCIPLFETLKDSNRQHLLVQLVIAGPQTVGELAESSTLSRTAVSHHIKLLEQAGLIEISKDATRRICSVRTDKWLPLLDELSTALKSDLAEAERCRTGK